MGRLSVGIARSLAPSSPDAAEHVALRNSPPSLCDRGPRDAGDLREIHEASCRSVLDLGDGNAFPSAAGG